MQKSVGGWSTRNIKIEKHPASMHEYLSLVVWTTLSEPGCFSIFVALITIVSLVAWIHGEPQCINNSSWAWTLLYFCHINNCYKLYINNAFKRLVGKNYTTTICPIIFGDLIKIMEDTNWQEWRQSIENRLHSYFPSYLKYLWRGKIFSSRNLLIKFM